MTTPHLLLLCVLAGAALYILRQLEALLRQGSSRAREVGLQRESSRKDDGFNADSVRHSVKWKELNRPVRKPLHVGERCKKWLRDWTPRLQRLNMIVSKSAPMQGDVILDPLDGTVFEPHEAVVRCSCGTVYHEDSWQWIGEKNGAKCVNCKKVALVTHGCADELTSELSSSARCFGRSLS